MRRELTSAQLGELTGYHPNYLRRSIKRPPSATKKEPGWDLERRALRKARAAFRETLAHLPVNEIMKQAKVSHSTAARIKKAKK